jgi:hypothetical protein
MPDRHPSPGVVRHLRRATTLLDDGIRLPGTSFRFGLDPILGLVPGIGDAAGAALSAVIVGEAVRQGVSRYTLARMAGNVALDAAIGTVPLLGDLFDAAWKANRRNLILLERHLVEPPLATRADRRFIAILLGALIVLCVGLMVLGAVLSIAVMRWLVTSI